jgi:hypothetical protein
MLPTKVIAWSASAASLVCLSVGYGLKGYWAIFLVLPAIPIFWFMLRKVSPRIAISVLFFMVVLLAATGLLIKLLTPLMLIACASALAAWESAQFLFNFQGLSTNLLDARLEQRHNWDMAIALGSGLLLAFLGWNIQFRLPFGVIAVLALLVMYWMYRAVSLMK